MRSQKQNVIALLSRGKDLERVYSLFHRWRRQHYKLAIQNIPGQSAARAVVEAVS